MTISDARTRSIPATASAVPVIGTDDLDAFETRRRKDSA